jgi:hypothetical protein
MPKVGAHVINQGVSSFILQEVKKLLQGSNPRAFVKLPVGNVREFP